MNLELLLFSKRTVKEHNTYSILTIAELDETDYDCIKRQSYTLKYNIYG